MKPTARPWHVINDNMGDGWRITTTPSSYAKKPIYLGDCYGPDAEANAAHIVKCVNMHEAFLGKLNLLKNAFSAIAGDHPQYRGIAKSAIVEIDELFVCASEK